MQTVKTAPTFLRESFTQKLAFPTKPPVAVRKALVAAGWKFNGLHWWKNVNSTRTIKPRDLAAILTPGTSEVTPELATA